MTKRAEPVLCSSRVLRISTGPGPPTKFSVQDISDIYVVLTWSDPVNTNGIIRFYHIRTYDTITGREVDNKVFKKQNDPQTQVISKLKPFTNYTFVIQADTIEPGEMAKVTATTKEGGN